MASNIRKDHLDVASRLGVMDCFSCGSCSWVCPSHIPLVHYFNYAKGMLAEQDREQKKTERTKALAEEHGIRVEKAEAVKKAAMAAKQAEMAAKQAAAQAAKAQAATAADDKAST
jgi:electron transport complex protein RnfC